MPKAHFTLDLPGCSPGSANAGIMVAATIATKYQHRVPDPKELIEMFGMSRATAYRWVRAFKDARGLQ